MSADYAEFNESLLADVYDSFCPLGEDSDFFLGEVEKLHPKVVLDVGCGSGILTVELAKIAQQVIGVEPAAPMLEIARKRPGGDTVRWIQGYATDVTDVKVDAIIMTSHVAQFFLDENEWHSALRHLHRLLNPGGKLIFDSKNPLVEPWQSWSKESTQRSADTPHGNVTMWNELVPVEGSRVQYQLHYQFESGEKLISNNELVYRSKEYLICSLNKAGFELENLYGDWDSSPASKDSPELIFISKTSIVNVVKSWL